MQRSGLSSQPARRATYLASANALVSAALFLCAASAQIVITGHAAAPASATSSNGTLVARTATAPELLYATDTGVRHIVVTGHVDLTQWAGPTAAVVVAPSVRSIRGACSESVGDGTHFSVLRRPRKEQCMLFGSIPLVEVRAESDGQQSGDEVTQFLILSDLYLSAAAPAGAGARAALLSLGGGVVWLRHVEMDAAGHEDVIAIEALPGPTPKFVHMHEGSFQHFKNVKYPLVDLVAATMVVSDSAVIGCTLPAPRMVAGHFVAVQLRSGGFAPSRLWLQDSRFVGNMGLHPDTMQLLPRAFPAVEGDDLSTLYTNVVGTAFVAAGRLRGPEVPGAGSFASQDFWTEDRPEFADIAEEQAELTALPPLVPEALVPNPQQFLGVEPASMGGPSEESPESPGVGTRGKNKWILVAVLACGVATVLLAVLAAAVVVRALAVHRSHDGSEAAESQHAHHSAKVDKAEASHSSRRAWRKMFGASESPGDSSRGSSRIGAAGNAEATLDPQRPVTIKVYDDVDELENTLDYMHTKSELLLKRYRLLGPTQRKQSTSGVVQLATCTRTNRFCALKFYPGRDAFALRVARSRNPGLKSVVPRVHAVQENTDGLIRCSNGSVLPPFIVCEAGTSLKDWAAKVEPTRVNCGFILCHLAKALKQLHTCRLSHRNLRPSSFLLFDVDSSWKLSDCGIGAEDGQPTDVCFNPHYAAPEVVAAWDAGKATVVADSSADVWALGVIAFELLTRTQVFAASMKEVDVLDRVRGRERLPWEDPVRSPELLNALGPLKPSILSCLERDPTRRPTARQLLRAWKRVTMPEVSVEVAAGQQIPVHATQDVMEPFRDMERWVPTSTDTCGGTFSGFTDIALSGPSQPSGITGQTCFGTIDALYGGRMQQEQ